MPDVNNKRTHRVPVFLLMLGAASQKQLDQFVVFQNAFNDGDLITVPIEDAEHISIPGISEWPTK
jgi:hypothetical protein